jgi:hypothetical protein
MDHDDDNQAGGNALITDLYHRVRFMEQNLPPRVQNLENAVADIREEFRGMRTEQRESARETHEALNSFRGTLERNDQSDSERALGAMRNEREVNDTLQLLGRKITFASGAFWAVTALLAFAAYHWQTIAPILAAARATE